jgi:outer membrane protein
MPMTIDSRCAAGKGMRAWAVVRGAALVLAWLVAPPGFALDLVEAFELAQTNDPVYRAATYERLAEDSSLRIAWSSLLPNASAEAGYTKTRQDIQSSDNALFEVGSTSFPVKTYGATLTQPLFRMTDWANVSQARASVRQAAAELDNEYQSLLFRTADAYLSATEAVEQLDLRRQEREALYRQSEISRKRLDSGLGILPDVLEAEARFQLAEADEEIARVELADANQALAEIIGRVDSDLGLLDEVLPLADPEPSDPAIWVRTATRQSPLVEASRQAVVVADREVDKQRAAHLPTLDFTASINNRDTDGSPLGGGSNVETAEYGVQVRVPLFSGGATLFATRRARDLHRRNKQQLIQTERQVERETRDAYQSVRSIARRVRALRKTVEVQARAVEARQKSVRAGVDTEINVLNAERELYAALRDYTQGRYEYVRTVLRLERSVGALGVEDLEEVAEWMR